MMHALRARDGADGAARFVFLDRAAIGLGAAFLRLRAEMNFHRLFEETIADFSPEIVGGGSGALEEVGLGTGFPVDERVSAAVNDVKPSASPSDEDIAA